MDILIADSLLPVPAYQKGEKVSTPIMAQATYVDFFNGLLDYGLTGMDFVHFYLCPFNRRGPTLQYSYDTIHSSYPVPTLCHAIPTNNVYYPLRSS